MDRKEDLAAGKRNPAHFEKKGGVSVEKSVLLLSDDRETDRAAGDAVRPDQTAAGAETEHC